MPDTIRLQCLKAIKARLAALFIPTGDEIPPVADPYTIQFSSVDLGPLSEMDHRKRYTAGIVPGTERKEDKFYPLRDCTLPVTIEWRMTHNRGDQKPAEEAERVTGEIQRCIGEDTTLGGLAIDLQEVGNDIDLDDYGDKSIVGAVHFDLKYRHRHDDPRTIATPA